MISYTVQRPRLVEQLVGDEPEQAEIAESVERVERVTDPTRVDRRPGVEFVCEGEDLEGLFREVSVFGG